MHDEAKPEEWRPIPGYHGYEVSSLGRIMSYRKKQPRLLRPATNSHGYPFVSPLGVAQCVHTLVALAFYGPRREGMQVRHLDGNPTNNRVENLRYGTSSENNLDRVRHGTHSWANKTHCPQGHPYDEANTRHYRGMRYCRACKRDWDRARRRAA